MKANQSVMERHPHQELTNRSESEKPSNKRTMAKKKTTKAAAEAPPEFVDRLELKHSFSDAEKAGILDLLSRKHEEKESLAAQAKSSAKQWKGRIDEVQLKITELSQKGRDGFELRPTDVRVVLNKKKKKKTLYRVDNDELIEERDMTDHDFERLPMTIPLPPDPIAPGEGLVKGKDAFDKAESEDATEEESSAG
jgi:hypothetical protein